MRGGALDEAKAVTWRQSLQEVVGELELEQKRAEAGLKQAQVDVDQRLRRAG
jgi:hypothetical protein